MAVVQQRDAGWTGSVTSVAMRAAEVMAAPRFTLRLSMWFAVAIVAGGILNATGLSSSLVIAAVIAVIGVTAYAWKRNSSAVLAVASTVFLSGAVVAVGGTSSAATLIDGGFAHYAAYLVGLWAIALLVLRSPRTGVSPAITVGLAQLVLMATLPVQMWTKSSGAAVGGLLLALVVVWWRLRLAPTAELPASGRMRFVVRIQRIVTAVVAAALLSGTMMLGSAAPAQAFGLSSIIGSITEPVQEAMCGLTAPNLEQQPVGAGPESWFSNKNLAGATDSKTGQVSENAADVTLVANEDMTKYTLYEIAGLRGMDWVNWQYSPSPEDPVKPDMCSIPAWMWTMAGNAVFTVNLYLLQATIALKEFAQGPNPVAWLYDKSDSLVANFFVSGAVPIMSIAVICSALAVGFAAVRGGGREALGKVAASMGVMVLGGVIFGGLALSDNGGPSMENPNGSGFYTIASTLDSTIGGLNSAVTTGVLSNISTDSGEEFCHVPSGDDSKLGQRLSSCVLAETLAYRPWALGQFGPSGSEAIFVDSATQQTQGNPVQGVRYGDDAKIAGEGLPCYTNLDMCHDLRSYLIVQQGGPSIGNQITECLGGGSPEGREQAEQCVPYFAAAKVLADRVNATAESADDAPAAPESSVDARTLYNSFTGTNGLQRLTQASSSLVGTLVIAIALISLSIITLVWHVTLFALFMIGPVVLAAATFSGKSHLAKEWAFNVLHTFSARAVYGLVMTLIIFLICLVFRSKLEDFMKILIVGMVLFGFWKLIRKVDEMIRPQAGTMNMNVADKTREGMTKATGARQLNNAASRKISQAPRALNNGAKRAIPGAAQAGKSATLATGRVVRGAGVGTVNALGGTHKANLDSVRDQKGVARVTARRMVTAPITGTGGAIRGAYQGARGRTPTYNGAGTNRAVDTTARVGKEVRFQAQFAAMRTKDWGNRKLNPSRQVAAQQYKTEQEAKRNAGKKS